MEFEGIGKIKLFRTNEEHVRYSCYRGLDFVYIYEISMHDLQGFPLLCTVGWICKNLK